MRFLPLSLLLLLTSGMISCSRCPVACARIFACLNHPQWAPQSCIPRCKELKKLALSNGYEKQLRQFMDCAVHLTGPPYCRGQFQQCAAEIPEWIWMKAGFRTRK